jgi:hypothetical protein
MISVEIRFKTLIKKIQNMRDFFNVLYSGTLVHKQVRVKFKVPEYESRFPSTGPVPKYGSSINNYSTYKFPSMGPGSRERVKVPEYGFLGK